MTDEYAAIRPDIREALDDYAATGHVPGDFLYAVLTNDLREAAARADRDNAPALVLIVQYVYNRLPAACWGSPAKVAAWERETRLHRIAAFYSEAAAEAREAGEPDRTNDGQIIGQTWMERDEREPIDLTPHGQALLADATARVKDGRAPTYQIALQQATAARDKPECGAVVLDSNGPTGYGCALPHGHDGRHSR